MSPTWCRRSWSIPGRTCRLVVPCQNGEGSTYAVSSRQLRQCRSRHQPTQVRRNVRARLSKLRPSHYFLSCCHLPWFQRWSRNADRLSAGPSQHVTTQQSQQQSPRPLRTAITVANGTCAETGILINKPLTIIGGVAGRGDRDRATRSVIPLGLSGGPPATVPAGVTAGDI